MMKAGKNMAENHFENLPRPEDMEYPGRHNLFETPLLPDFSRADLLPIINERPAQLANHGNVSTSIDVPPRSIDGKEG